DGTRFTAESVDVARRGARRCGGRRAYSWRHVATCAAAGHRRTDPGSRSNPSARLLQRSRALTDPVQSLSNPAVVSAPWPVAVAIDNDVITKPIQLGGFGAMAVSHV